MVLSWFYLEEEYCWNWFTWFYTVGELHVCILYSTRSQIRSLLIQTDSRYYDRKVHYN